MSEALEEAISEKSPKALEELLERVRKLFPTNDYTIIESTTKTAPATRQNPARLTGHKT